MDVKLFATIRKVNGMTQKEYADLLGVSQSTISKIEINDRELTQDLISRVKRVYSADYIDEVRSFLSR